MQTRSPLATLLKGRVMTRRATSLLEVMFSILILGIGLTGVAGLFPTAAAIQKNTFDDTLGKQVAENVQASIRARGFSKKDMKGLTRLPKRLTQPVQPIPRRVLNNQGSTQAPWLLPDRCYPSPTSADPLGVAGSHYWVPLVQEQSKDEWRVFVFVMQRSNSTRYGPHGGAANPDDPDAIPDVRSVNALQVTGDKRAMKVADATRYFAEGDAVLGSEGQVLKVLQVEADSVTFAQPVDPQTKTLWYAARNGSKSSAKQVLVLDGVVR